MEIEFSQACNFRCPYCYNDEAFEAQELKPEEIDDLVIQAKELGAKKIIILGGEPMIYPEIRERIEFLRENDLTVEMFTNGTNMTPENARFMYEHDVAVVLKLNTFDRELQNELTGCEKGYEIIHGALKNLQESGYPSPAKRLAISTIICKQNIDELPDLWRWARNHGIEPYFEMITPQGRSIANEWLLAPISEQKELFDELSRIDREEFDHEWDPQPPLVGNRCLRHQFSCLVASDGSVMPCVGVTIPMGNIREEPLEQILDRSEVMEKLRHFPEYIREPCRSCEKSGGCYGCRGSAYQLTGDFLAADPFCWRNQDKKIQALPCHVTPFLPHKHPMLMVKELVSVGERRGKVRATPLAEDIFVDEDGVLDETAYVELLAQSIAAVHGFLQNEEERKKHDGLLMSARNVEVSGLAHVGDTLEISVHKTVKMGDFGVVQGSISKDGAEIANGQISIWQPSNGEKTI
ncbi:MAG: radical SAM protein [Planctomycetes bacterium]|nr:radical SAM protein [Planctomycetota bacterium]